MCRFAVCMVASSSTDRESQTNVLDGSKINCHVPLHRRVQSGAVHYVRLKLPRGQLDKVLTQHGACALLVLLGRAIATAHAPGKPLLITEWSSGSTSMVNGTPPLHDQWQMAAFVLAAVLNATDTPGIDLAAHVGYKGNIS